MSVCIVMTHQLWVPRLRWELFTGLLDLPTTDGTGFFFNLHKMKWKITFNYKVGMFMNFFFLFLFECSIICLGGKRDICTLEAVAR